MKKRGKIRIELQSDLCVSSGYSYAGIVDSDICYDEYGIPFIPARRLKGCLRETAEGVLYSFFRQEDIYEIFGIGGAADSQGLIIRNAYIENYTDIVNELHTLKNKMPTYISSQLLLEQFTHIQVQTKLSNGVAVDKSLRYTRVVDEISPITGKPLVFLADVEFDVNEDVLKNIVKGTRNIGLKRNRGNGLVRCDLIDVIDNDKCIVGVMPDSDRAVTIQYTIQNQEPLMLSGQNDYISERYISGQSILGMLASKYLRIEGKSAESKEFEDIFLNGTTCFTNVYPGKDMNIYYPAPEYVNKLKKTKKLVNTLFAPSSHHNGENDSIKGNQPKKLKNAFILYDVDSNNVDIKEVAVKTVYHNNHRIEEGGLYTQNVVCEGQEFTGCIYTIEKYADLIIGLLSNGSFTLGKSKTAEYGYCVLSDVRKITDTNKDRNFKKGQTLVITLLSDGVFWGESDFSCECSVVKDSIAEQLHISYSSGGCNTYETDMIKTGQITGYQTMWNLRKAPIPVIKSGSCFVYKLKEDVSIDANFVGKKNQEGYGQFSVHALEQMQYLLNEHQENSGTDIGSVDCIHIKDLITKIICDDITERIKLYLIENKKLDINNTQLGRITLMLRESVEGNNAENDFNKRIDSIKTDFVRTKAKAINNLLPLYSIIANEKESIAVDGIEALQKLGYDQIQIKELINKRWPECIMNWLTYLKYTAE